MSPAPRTSQVEVGGRELRLSNLDKVLWPKAGYTKAQMIDYYCRVAPAMVPHLEARPVTLRRWPDGVEGQSFFQKNCPSHRPEWMECADMGDTRYCLISEDASLVWAANLASIELHPLLARVPALESPTALVFDLDPGPPADVLTCAEVGVRIRELLGQLGLEVFPKTSGAKGLQLYVPLNSGATYDATREFANAMARLLERERPELVLSIMEKDKRKGKVLIDWSQNTLTKTTVCVYSLRAEPTPSVSTPVTWDEVEGAMEAGDASRLRFGPDQVIERLERVGDLQSPVLELRQELPN